MQIITFLCWFTLILAEDTFHSPGCWSEGLFVTELMHILTFATSFYPLNLNSVYQRNCNFPQPRMLV